MKKILIITYSYPPLNNIAARRFSELALHFKEYNFKPYILTTNSLGDLKNDIPDSQIFRIGQHNQRNIQIEIAQSKKHVFTLLLNFKRKLGFNSRIYDRTYHTWFRKVKKSTLNKLEVENFDIIIASYGPGSALVIGNYLSKKFNVPLIVDFRDLGALFTDKYEKRNMITKIFDLLYEKRLMKRACAMTTVSKALKEELENKYKLPTEVIYNGWNKTQKNHIKDYTNLSTIYYAGRFYEHRYDSLVLLLNALRKVNYKLIIRSLGPEIFNKRIKEKAKQLKIEEKVEIRSPVDYDTIIRENQLATFSLVVEDLDETIKWKKGNLTGKFLSLLVNKPSILAIARNDSEIGEILEETEKGKLCSTTEEIIKYLKECNNKNNIPKYSVIQQYSKKRQTQKLVEFLNSIIK